MFLDNAGAVASGVGLRLVVAFTSDPESHRAELQEMMPPDSALELRVFPYSRLQLDTIASKLIEAAPRWREVGVETLVVGVDEVRNKVVVGISRHDDGVASAMASEFGASALHIYVSSPPRQDACGRTSCPAPWPAGLNISSNTGDHCTSGYSMQATSGNWYMLTAGHCPGDRWYHNGTFMGATPSGKNAFVNNSNADVQAYDIANANRSNVLITGSSTCASCPSRTMTARQNVTDDQIGDTTCKSGAYGGSDCGVLKSFNFAFYYASYSKWLLNQRVATYTRERGDSGGPVFYSTVALGSHVHFQDDTGWAVYSHIWFAEQRLSLAMCFSGC